MTSNIKILTFLNIEQTWYSTIKYCHRKFKKIINSPINFKYLKHFNTCICKNLCYSELLCKIQNESENVRIPRGYKIFIGIMYFAKITNLFELSIIYYIDKPQHVARPSLALSV